MAGPLQIKSGFDALCTSTGRRVGLLEYAADTAALVLPAYEAALGVEFPLPKMDLVVRPRAAWGGGVL